MNLYLTTFWIFLGSAMAFFILKLQWWSILAIKPEKPQKSRNLILLGLIFRLILMACIFVFAGSQSLIALLIVFTSFMSTRFILLAKYHKYLKISKNQIH